MKMPNIDFKKIALNVAGAGAGAFVSNALTKALPANIRDNPKTLGLVKVAAGAFVPSLLGSKVKGEMAHILEGASYGLLVDGVFDLMKGFNFGVSGIGNTTMNPATLQTPYGTMVVPDSTADILAGIGSMEELYKMAKSVTGDDVVAGDDDVVAGAGDDDVVAGDDDYEDWDDDDISGDDDDEDWDDEDISGDDDDEDWDDDDED